MTASRCWATGACPVCPAWSCRHCGPARACAQVALGAAREYLRQLEGIPALSAAGGGQAAADAEYFCNVLSALGVPLPPQLGTWQVGWGQGCQGFGQVLGRWRGPWGTLQRVQRVSCRQPRAAAVCRCCMTGRLWHSA